MALSLLTSTCKEVGTARALMDRPSMWQASLREFAGKAVLGGRQIRGSLKISQRQTKFSTFRATFRQLPPSFERDVIHDGTAEFSATLPEDTAPRVAIRVWKRTRCVVKMIAEIKKRRLARSQESPSPLTNHRIVKMACSKIICNPRLNAVLVREISRNRTIVFQKR